MPFLPPQFGDSCSWPLPTLSYVSDVCGTGRAALCGQVDFETRPTIDHSGKLTTHANPWAIQLREDLEALGACDDGRDLVQELDGRVLLVFSTFKDASVSIDCSVLHRQSLSVTIPPPRICSVPAPGAPRHRGS